jgi:hypothetical protein
LISFSGFSKCVFGLQHSNGGLVVLLLSSSDLIDDTFNGWCTWLSVFSFFGWLTPEEVGGRVNNELLSSVILGGLLSLICVSESLDGTVFVIESGLSGSLLLDLSISGVSLSLDSILSGLSFLWISIIIIN